MLGLTKLFRTSASSPVSMSHRSIRTFAHETRSMPSVAHPNTHGRFRIVTPCTEKESHNTSLQVQRSVFLIVMPSSAKFLHFLKQMTYTGCPPDTVSVIL